MLAYAIQQAMLSLLGSRPKAGVRPSRPIMSFSGLTQEGSRLLGANDLVLEGVSEDNIQILSEIVNARADDVKHVQQVKPSKVLDVDQYPYSAVGMIIVYQKGKILGHGTGSLIGQNLVLTTARNCYPMYLNQQVELQFIPAPILKRNHKGFKVNKRHFPQLYKQAFIKKDQNKEMKVLLDFAVLELDTQDNLQKYFGSFGYDFQQTKYKFQQTAKDISIIGYSLSKEMDEYNGQVYVDKHCFLSNIPATKGMSGSPVFSKKDQQCKIVGVYSQNVDKLIASFHTSLKVRKEIFEFTKKNLNQHHYNWNCNRKCFSKQDFIALINDVEDIIKNNLSIKGIRLNLEGNNIGAEQCSYLSQFQWSNLQALDLKWNKIGDEGCKYLSQSNWKSFVMIDLEDNYIADKGCFFLSQCKWDNLQKLHLKWNNIGAEGCSYLAKSKLNNLYELDLNFNAIGAEGCRNLSQSKWTNLLKLDLGDNCIGAKGCKLLSHSQWANLRTLELRGNKFGAEGCSYLSHSQLNNLLQLGLQSNYIGDNGCIYIQQSNWKSLKRLNLCRNNIGVVRQRFHSQFKWRKQFL